jgi:hypothetical protein
MLAALADSSWHTCPWEMGRADLEQRLIRLYQKANPSKISDAFSVSEEVHCIPKIAYLHPSPPAP